MAITGYVLETPLRSESRSCARCGATTSHTRARRAYVPALLGWPLFVTSQSCVIECSSCKHVDGCPIPPDAPPLSAFYRYGIVFLIALGLVVTAVWGLSKWHNEGEISGAESRERRELPSKIEAEIAKTGGAPADGGGFVDQADNKAAPRVAEKLASALGVRDVAVRIFHTTRFTSLLSSGPSTPGDVEIVVVRLPSGAPTASVPELVKREHLFEGDAFVAVSAAWPRLDVVLRATKDGLHEEPIHSARDLADAAARLFLDNLARAKSAM